MVTRDSAKPASFPEGSRFAPSYRVGSKTGADRCLIHDNDFVTDTDPDDAAKLAFDELKRTEMYGLFWDGKVVIIPRTGVRCVHGAVGPIAVLFISGPGFDRVQESEREVYAAIESVINESRTLPPRLTENDVDEA